MLERQAARERRLAEQQHGAGVLVAGRDLAERGERGGVLRAVAEVGEHAGHEVALADGIEELDRAHDLELRSVRWRSGGGRSSKILHAELGARDLAVIGGRVLRRRLVVGARLVAGGPSPRRRGPANSSARASEIGLLMPCAILAKCVSAVAGSLRKRSAIQPAVNWCSTR